MVDALSGAPGVYSARFSGEGATDEKNNAKLIAELADVPDERRGAQYLCHAAISDPTRRGILHRLGRGDASISDLAASFDMTLTGMKKHVKVLEHAGLVTTEKIGRVRYCRPTPRRLQRETDWITRYEAMLEARYDRLGEFLERTSGDPS